MSNEVTTTIVAIQYPATVLQSAITGIAFLWLGKIRTLWFRNYSFPKGTKVKGSSYNRSRLTAEIRVEIEHNVPRLRIFTTRAQDGKMKAFHIEKTSGLPFDEGQLEIVNLYS